MDGKKNLLAYVTASNYKSRIPALAIRCEPGTTSLLFDGGRVLEDTGDGSSVLLRIKYDDAPPRRVFGSPSTNYHGAFIRTPAWHIRSLLKAKRALVEFTPFQQAPIIAEFDVSGLDQHLPLLKKHCRL